MSLGSQLLKSVKISFVHSHLKNRPNCYSNHHADKPHHLTSQSRLFQSEAKPISTSPLQRIQPTAQLASTVQIKRKSQQNNVRRNQVVQRARWTPWLFWKRYRLVLLAFFFYLFNVRCSWTTCSHAWADKQKSFGRVQKYIRCMRKQYK